MGRLIKVDNLDWYGFEYFYWFGYCDERGCDDFDGISCMRELCSIYVYDIID